MALSLPIHQSMGLSLMSSQFHEATTLESGDLAIEIRPLPSIRGNVVLGPRTLVTGCIPIVLVTTPPQPASNARRMFDSDSVGGADATTWQALQALSSGLGFPLTAGQVHAMLETAHPAEGGDWGWNWTPAKRALELLFFTGEVAAAGRNSERGAGMVEASLRLNRSFGFGRSSGGTGGMPMMPPPGGGGALNQRGTGGGGPGGPGGGDGPQIMIMEGGAAARYRLDFYAQMSYLARHRLVKR